MVTEERLMVKLCEMGCRFDEAWSKNEWSRACFIYEKAMYTAAVVELSEENMITVFGSRDNEQFDTGFFDQKLVEDAYAHMCDGSVYYDARLFRREENI